MDRVRKKRQFGQDTKYNTGEN